MKQVSHWRALARASVMTAAYILAGAALAGPASKPMLRGTLGEPSGTAVQPQAGPNLKFFTIAQRVAALRANGQLPEARTEPQARPEITTASLVVTTPAPDRPAVKPVPNLLGMAVLPVPGGELASKWQEMAERWDAEKAVIEECRLGPCGHRGAAKWLEIAATAAKRDGREQLAYVHASINRSISYASDFIAYGAADYWASPLESVEKLGDCEDYAIAKYMMMRSLGHTAEDLKLVVMFQRWSGLYHAILAVRLDGKWVYMDNQRAELTGESDYRGVQPIATLDETGQSLLAALPKPVEPAAAAPLPMLRGPR